LKGKYPQRAKHKTTDDRYFEANKQAILDRDMTRISRELGVEFNYLKNQAGKLKKQLENLGYRDLLWR
jgi:hypothetical protein